MSLHNMPSRHRKGSRDTVPLILNLAGGWSTSRPGRFTPVTGTLYPLYSRLDLLTSLIPSKRSTRLGAFLAWRRKHSRHSKCHVSLKLRRWTKPRQRISCVIHHRYSLTELQFVSVFHNTRADYRFACTSVSTNGASEVHDPRNELQRAAVCLLCLQALLDLQSVCHVAVRLFVLGSYLLNGGEWLRLIPLPLHSQRRSW